jgi:hypothetical protein
MVMDFKIPCFNEKDGDIPSPLIMFTYHALGRALLQWRKIIGVCPKASMSKLNADRHDPWNYFSYMTNGGKLVSC